MLQDFLSYIYQLYLKIYKHLPTEQNIIILHLFGKMTDNENESLNLVIIAINTLFPITYSNKQIHILVEVCNMFPE